MSGHQSGAVLCLLHDKRCAELVGIGIEEGHNAGHTVLVPAAGVRGAEVLGHLRAVGAAVEDQAHRTPIHLHLQHDRGLETTGAKPLRHTRSGSGGLRGRAPRLLLGRLAGPGLQHCEGLVATGHVHGGGGRVFEALEAEERPLLALGLLSHHAD